MTFRERESLVKKITLSVAEIAEIERLVEVCNSYEGLHTRLSRAMLAERPKQEVNDFLYYQDDKLVGYLGLENWGVEDRELHIGVVHPDYRNRGIFRTLLEAAQDEWASRGAKKIVLVSESASSSGTSAATALGARYAFSEHEMVLQDFQDSYAFDDRLTFEEADASEIDALVAVQSRSFQDSEAFVLLMVTKFLQDPHRHFYLARFGEEGLGCREPVGVLRLDEYDDRVGIYGFGVLPEYRGRGYGRQMLEEAIRLVRGRSQKTIKLEVDTNNLPALNLYQSCGFRIYTTYSYYILDI